MPQEYETLACVSGTARFALAHAHLLHAHLVHAHLVHAHLVHAHLVHAHLVHAHLVHAHLFVCAWVCVCSCDETNLVFSEHQASVSPNL